MKQKVKVYSKIGCSYCEDAKEFLEKKKIDFIDIDVEDDNEKMNEMIEKSGQMGVPVIIIGNQIVVGFNKEKIEKLIRK